MFDVRVDVLTYPVLQGGVYVRSLDQQWPEWRSAILHSEAVKLNRWLFPDRSAWIDAVRQSQSEADANNWFADDHSQSSREILQPLIRDATLWFSQERENIERSAPTPDVSKCTQLAQNVSDQTDAYSGQLHAVFCVLLLTTEWIETVTDSMIACSLSAIRDERLFAKLIEEQFIASSVG